MATPEERLLLQRAAKIARQRQNYREKRQALLDAFPYLAQRKVSLHRAGASCQTLDGWRHDSARGAADAVREPGVPVGAQAAEGAGMTTAVAFFLSFELFFHFALSFGESVLILCDVISP